MNVTYSEGNEIIFLQNSLKRHILTYDNYALQRGEAYSCLVFRPSIRPSGTLSSK